MWDMQKLRNAYNVQKYDATKRRGISFELTFEEWLDIWVRSKRLQQRGNVRGKYVMARFGDQGPYAIENVRIVSVEQNSRENGANLARLRKTPFFKKSVRRMGTKAYFEKYPHSANAKLTDDQVTKIKTILHKNSQWGVNRQLANTFGVSDQVISSIKRGVSYR